MLKTVLTTTIALLLAVASAPAQMATQDIVIRIAWKGSPFGGPVYTLTLTGDGLVRYEGFREVRVQGVQQRRVSPEAVKALANEFLKARFFALDDHYSVINNPDGTQVFVTDQTTRIVYAKIGDLEKTVTDYVGAPQELENLEKEIDAVAGSDRWVWVDREVIQELLDNGLDPGSDEARKYLQQACWLDRPEVVEALVKAGVDVNGPVHGTVPLQAATSGKVVHLLLNAGASVKVSNSSHVSYFVTPLQQAIRLGDLESVSALLDAGANPNETDEYGETAVMMAVSGKSPEKLALLLSRGAEVNRRDKDGHTALHYMPQSDFCKDALFPDLPRKCAEMTAILTAAGATK